MQPQRSTVRDLDNYVKASQDIQGYSKDICKDVSNAKNANSYANVLLIISILTSVVSLAIIATNYHNFHLLFSLNAAFFCHAPMAVFAKPLLLAGGVIISTSFSLAALTHGIFLIVISHNLFNKTLEKDAHDFLKDGLTRAVKQEGSMSQSLEGNPTGYMPLEPASEFYSLKPATNIGQGWTKLADEMYYPLVPGSEQGAGSSQNVPATAPTLVTLEQEPLPVT